LEGNKGGGGRKGLNIRNVERMVGEGREVKSERMEKISEGDRRQEIMRRQKIKMGHQGKVTICVTRT